MEQKPFGPYIVSNTAIDTGLIVEADQRIHVDAKGFMNVGGSSSGGRGEFINSPDGQDPTLSPTPYWYPAPNLRMNSLVVQIGPLLPGRQVG